MIVYRGSKSDEVFEGMHFSDTREESEGYTEQYVGERHSGDSFDGTVRTYEIEGDILEVENVGELIEFLLESVENGEVTLDELGLFGKYVERIQDKYWIDHLPERYDVEKWMNEEQNITYVHQLLNTCDEVVEFLESTEWSFIEWPEQSINSDELWGGEFDTLTYRYLGGGSVTVVDEK